MVDKGRDVSVKLADFSLIEKQILANLEDSFFGLEAIVGLVDEVEDTQEALTGFVDALEGGQEDMQGAQDAMQAAQVALAAAHLATQVTQENMITTQGAMMSAQEAAQAILVDEGYGLEAVKTKMDETLLPLSGEERYGVDNPLTLMELPQIIYWNESNNPFHFGGGSLCRMSGSWLAGEEVIIVIESKESGGWEVIWDEKYSQASDIERKPVPQLYNDGSGLRISIRQKIEGDGFHIWSFSLISAERGE